MLLTGSTSEIPGTDGHSELKASAEVMIDAYQWGHLTEPKIKTADVEITFHIIP